MIRRRHRSWFQRTVLLAMAALLWSQFALASHGGCLGLPGTPAAAVAAGADTPHDHGHGCDAELPSADRAVCAAHCSEGGISADSGRIPPVPPLFVGAWVSWFVVAEVADRRVTTSQSRPPWDGEGDWISTPVARFRRTRATGLWSLYWSDRSSRLHEYETGSRRPTSLASSTLPGPILWG